MTVWQINRASALELTNDDATSVLVIGQRPARVFFVPSKQSGRHTCLLDLLLTVLFCNNNNNSIKVKGTHHKIGASIMETYLIIIITTL